MKFRKKLEKNSIYFSTIASVLLATMAIIVSINANELTKSQNQLTRFTNYPEFEVIIDYEQSDKTISWFDRELPSLDNISFTIYIKNGIAKNIKATTLTFAEISSTLPSSKKHNFYISDFNIQKPNPINNVVAVFINSKKHYKVNPVNIKTPYTNFSAEYEFTEAFAQLYQRASNISTPEEILFIRNIYVKLDFVDFEGKLNTEIYKYTVSENPKYKQRILENNRTAMRIENNDSLANVMNNIINENKINNGITIWETGYGLFDKVRNCNLDNTKTCQGHYLISDFEY